MKRALFSRIFDVDSDADAAHATLFASMRRERAAHNDERRSDIFRDAAVPLFSRRREHARYMLFARHAALFSPIFAIERRHCRHRLMPGQIFLRHICFAMIIFRPPRCDAAAWPAR